MRPLPATVRRGLAPLVAASMILSAAATQASSADRPDIPPEVDPGTPTYTGLDEPVPPEPAAFDPSTSMLQAIYDADVTAGGNSYWIDRILERPAGGSGGNALYTRGRGLYMYTHTAGTLGFAGGYAYRERPTGGNQSLYTLTISGGSLSEATAERRQYPSHWQSVHNATGLRVEQTKFITENNVAVTILTITNTGESATSRTVTASSPAAVANVPVGDEITGTSNARWGITQLHRRLSGDGFTVSGPSSLTRTIGLEPGESVTLKVQMGVTTQELPESTAEYERFRDFDPETALRTHLRQYNQWWVDNVPYIDVPDQNIKKMSYYRTFLNRFNHFDGNIPGNDYQFPVSIEGVLGWNNAIQLTQPMHMQDLKYFRNPLYSYGNWVSSGETSKCTAFMDNPGDPAHWNNSHEQYIAREAWNAYQVHGGDPAILDNLARYAECDVKGQLDRFDSNGNRLVEYASGFYTGNDADSVALHVYNPPNLGRNAPGRVQDRAESAMWYSGAKVAAQAYAIRANQAKAAEMDQLAEDIKSSILGELWDDRPADAPGGGQVFKHRDVESGELIPWKDQQNFTPFIERLVPTDDPKYREALRYYADADEFPIMPFYTANQRDKAEAAAAGRPGSNNFSNINSTLQAQVFAAALRHYPSEYVTPGMYRALLEWLTWVQYVGGDNRLPNNNEFFSSWNPQTQTLTRSGISHNILGAYNFMIIDDIAGVRPRLDDVIELWPIDVGWDYFAINNLRYHGKDMTVVWNKPGAAHYPNVPEGYSVYLDGERVFTVDRLAHVTWNSTTGAVSVLDDSGATVTFSTKADLSEATAVSLASNERVVDMFQKAGVDLTLETGWLTNLAEGKPATASFVAPESSPADAVDGFTLSGPTVRPGFYAPNPSWGARNPIWSTQGSPNDQDWLEIDLGQPLAFDTVKLYFFSDKSFGGAPPQGPAIDGDTYRQPAAYTIQYHDGSDWVDVPGQVRTPDVPQANYNLVTFPEVTSDRVRVLMTPTGDFGVGVKEIQVFDSVDCDRTITGTHTGPLRVTSGVTCLDDGATVSGPVSVTSGAGFVASGATINGPVTARGATVVHIADSRINGPVSLTGTTDRLVLSGTTVTGPTSITGNNTGDTPIVIADNTIGGPLACTGNQPPPSNGGLINTTTGPKTGQCSPL